MRNHRVDATIFGAAPLLALALGGVAPERLAAPVPAGTGDAAPLVGVWRSADSTVKLRLDADWSYLGSVEGRHRAARGTYRPQGSGLVLRDETGLRTPVTVAEDVLEMAGHQLFKA
ncbi:Atu4866 domain-containing protein [Actinoplanes sp. NPDC049599]|uniref:Atu4866 domain-containing protein n=1 Tax=Actinoplanes sp. NPDC049599 TaxID=3363903 RepID=UPI0037AB4131